MTIEVSRPERGPYGASITVPGNATRHRSELVAALDAHAADAVQVWVEQATDADDMVLAELGFRPYRSLLRLGRPLPAAPSGLTTRAFDPTADAEAFLAVNNAAFHWHPEQSGMTRADLDARMAEPWFDPDGLRLLERDGRLVGFCWTKIHAHLTPPVGEIYVIGLDPSVHGQGLGGPMTLAGLEWLDALGLGHAILYVESDNAPARRTYDRLGFVHESTNRAYERAS